MCAKDCTDTISRSSVLRESVGPYPVRALLQQLKAVPAIYRDWRRRARLRGYLAQMTDHELMDIGLSRGEAQREANLPVWRRMELRRRS